MIGKGFRRPRCITLPDHETPLWCGRAGLIPGFGDQSWVTGSPAGPLIAGPPQPRPRPGDHPPQVITSGRRAARWPDTDGVAVAQPPPPPPPLLPQ
jgi:hypothetical protein